MTKDPKQQALQNAITQIEKQFGQGSIMTLSAAGKIDVDRMPTGSLSLDLALGGGIPKGRVVEIYGPESSGKTTLTLHVAAECQKRGGQVAFVDAEHALDPDYAQSIGLDLQKCTISQPDSGEQALEIVELLVRSGAVDLVIIDSVAALVPKAEIEGMMGDAHMGLQARLMSQALRKLTAAISKSKCTVIFINQLRMKIGVMFGNPETTPGGNALKFYSSVRMDIRRKAKIEIGTGDDKQAIGSRVRVKIVKNKTFPPFKQAEFDIMFKEGISREGDILDSAVSVGVVQKSGAFFTYGSTKLGQGRENAKQFLKENSKVTAEIDSKVRGSLKKQPLEEGKKEKATATA